MPGASSIHPSGASDRRSRPACRARPDSVAIFFAMRARAGCLFASAAPTGAPSQRLPAAIFGRAPPQRIFVRP